MKSKQGKGSMVGYKRMIPHRQAAVSLIVVAHIAMVVVVLAAGDQHVKSKRAADTELGALVYADAEENLLLQAGEDGKVIIRHGQSLDVLADLEAVVETNQLTLALAINKTASIAETHLRLLSTAVSSQMEEVVSREKDLEVATAAHVLQLSELRQAVKDLQAASPPPPPSPPAQVAIVGGSTDPGDTVDAGATSTVEWFDGTGWVDGGELPSPTTGLATAVFESVLLACGGKNKTANGMRRVLQYGESGWTVSQASLVTPRAFASAAVYQGSLYVVGGTNAAANALDTVERLDSLQGGFYVVSASMSVQRDAFGLAVFDNLLWAVGGKTVLAGQSTGTSSVESFDGATWKAGPSLPVKRWGVAVAVYANGLVALGGSPDTTNPQATVYMLKLGEAAWQSVGQLAVPRFFPAVAVFLNKLYVIGGKRAGDVVTASVEAFDASIDPVSGLTTLTSSIAPPLVTGRYDTHAVVITV
eukprot:m.362377 g.362377  ORF g.362377 m.362377 type:complete len:474 (+) comp20424_c0_seq1:24-1445(+)